MLLPKLLKQRDGKQQTSQLFTEVHGINFLKICAFFAFYDELTLFEQWLQLECRFLIKRRSFVDTVSNLSHSLKHLSQKHAVVGEHCIYEIRVSEKEICIYINLWHHLVKTARSFIQMDEFIDFSSIEMIKTSLSLGYHP